jgi:hypothetical protein
MKAERRFSRNVNLANCPNKKAARNVRLLCTSVEDRWLSYPLTGSFRQPFPIRPVRSSGYSLRRSSIARIPQPFPSLDFRMTVCVSQPSRTVVVDGREIHPPDSHTGRQTRVSKTRVIDAVMMFVNEHPSHGWTREITIFAKRAEGISRPMTVASIQPQPIGSKHRD